MKDKDERRILVEQSIFVHRPELLLKEGKLLEQDQKHLDKGRIILIGPLQRAEVKNQNGRIYPLSLLKREIDEYMNRIRENRALGCRDHDDDPVIYWESWSHNIIDMWWEGNTVMGKIIINNTAASQPLREAVDMGIPVGFSSRGLGSTTTRNGAIYVNNDYQIICWDAVTDPSTHGAFGLPEDKSNAEVPSLKESINKKSKIEKLLNEILRK